jgi:hypothetical protein
VGRAAATRLFERLENPGRRLKRKVVLPVSLVVRESCGPTLPSGRGAASADPELRRRVPCG